MFFRSHCLAQPRPSLSLVITLTSAKHRCSLKTHRQCQHPGLAEKPEAQLSAPCHRCWVGYKGCTAERTPNAQHHPPYNRGASEGGKGSASGFEAQNFLFRGERFGPLPFLAHELPQSNLRHICLCVAFLLLLLTFYHYYTVCCRDACNDLLLHSIPCRRAW